jgi:hypothetical protein
MRQFRTSLETIDSITVYLIALLALSIGMVYSTRATNFMNRSSRPGPPVAID